MQAGRRRHAAGQRAFAHRIDTPATPAPAANSSACRGVIAPDGNGRPRVRFISASQRASNTCGRMQRAVRHTLAQRSRASAPLALAATPAPASLSPVSRASSVARVCARSRLVQRVGRRGRAERARCRPRHAGGVYAFPAAQRVPGARRGHHEHAAHARASPQQQRRGQPRRSPVAVRATNSLVAHCGCAATACARGAEGARRPRWTQLRSPRWPPAAAAARHAATVASCSAPSRRLAAAGARPPAVATPYVLLSAATKVTPPPLNRHRRAAAAPVCPSLAASLPRTAARIASFSPARALLLLLLSPGACGRSTRPRCSRYRTHRQ